MASLVILAKDSNELKEIDEKIAEDGLKQDLVLEHKLRYMWRCWQRAESSLKSALEDVEALRRQHAEEMIEVENYVSHIRQLSEEREALTYEFESENEQLKAELEELKMEKNNSQVPAEEIGRLLVKKGQPLTSTLPIEDQLIRLANAIESDDNKILMLEAENEKLKLEGTSISSKMLEIMDSERSEMEREVTKMKEAMAVTREEDKMLYEQELTNVKEEKANLQNLVNESEVQIKSLLADTVQLNKVLGSEKEKHRAELAKVEEVYQAKLEVTLNEAKESQQKDDLKQKSHIKTLQCEVNSLREQLSAVIEEKKSLKDMINQLEEDLWTEKQNWDSTYQQSEIALVEEREKVVGKQKELEKAEAKQAQLQELNDHLEDLLSKANKDLDIAKRKEGDEASKQKSSHVQMTNTVNDLSRENRALNLRIAELESDVSEYTDTIETLHSKIKEKDELLKEAVQKATTKDSANRLEVSTLKKRLAETEAILEETTREYQLATSRYDETVSVLKSQETSHQKNLGMEQQEKKDLQLEVERLEQSLQKLQKQVDEDSFRNSSTGRKMSNEIEVILKEKEALTRELKLTEETYKQKHAELEAFKETVQRLNEERASLEQTVLIQEQKIEELSTEFERVKRKSEDQQTAIDKLTEENNKLSTELCATMEDLRASHTKGESLQREAGELHDELNVCKNSSLSNQAGLQKRMEEMKTSLDQTKEKEQRQQVIMNKDLNKMKEENFEMKTAIKELEKELQDSQLEVKSLTEVNLSLRDKFAEEGRQKRSLEGKLDVLEAELSSVKQKTEHLTADNRQAKAGTKTLEVELENKQGLIRKLESSVKEKQFENATLAVERDALKERLSGLENQINSSNRQIDTLRLELEKATMHLEESMDTQINIKAKDSEISMLKKSLEEEEKNRVMLTETIKELENQVHLLQKDRADHVDKYNNLNMLVSAKEESFMAIKRQQKATMKQHNDKESYVKDLQDKLEKFQLENTRLRMELSQRVGMLDDLKKKYDERKIQAYSKLQTLRERYTRERKSFETLISQLQNNLSITQNRLGVEAKWKKETEDSQRKLMEEKNLLTTRLTSVEEQLRDSSRELRQLKATQVIVQEENFDLNEKVRIGYKERQALERCLRELIEKEMFCAANGKSNTLDSRLVMDAYLNTLRPGAGLGRRPSPGPGEPNIIRRGPDGKGATTNFNMAKSGTSSGFASPMEDYT